MTSFSKDRWQQSGNTAVRSSPSGTVLCSLTLLNSTGVLTRVASFWFREYVNYWKFYFCAVSCFKQYPQLITFSEMHKTTVCTFTTQQQQCSLKLSFSSLLHRLFLFLLLPLSTFKFTIQEERSFDCVNKVVGSVFNVALSLWMMYVMWLYLWFCQLQCLGLRSVLSVFINLRSAECVCSYYGLRVCS